MQLLKCLQHLSPAEAAEACPLHIDAWKQFFLCLSRGTEKLQCLHSYELPFPVKIRRYYYPVCILGLCLQCINHWPVEYLHRWLCIYELLWIYGGPAAVSLRVIKFNHVSPEASNGVLNLPFPESEECKATLSFPLEFSWGENNREPQGHAVLLTYN